MSRLLWNRAVSSQLISRLEQYHLNKFVRSYHNRALIGTREVVGYGANGTYNYSDNLTYPYPAIRFREDTPEIKVLKEKEKGDWKNLTIEEKKTLYRASFWRTLHELEAKSGDWKLIISFTFFALSLAIWVENFFKVFICPPLPESCSLENRKKQLRIMLDLKIDPIEGVSSRWDYENDTWKK